MTDDELLERLGEAMRADAAGAEPSDDRIDALRQAAVRAGAGSEDRRPQHAVAASSGSRSRFGWAAAAAALGLVAGIVIATAIDGDDPVEVTDDGVVEYAGPITSDGNDGDLTVVRTGIGRVITLETDDLEILPTGEYYEVWFVAEGDEPGSPDRISAGTFHPDADGRSDVTFAAAVDPALYPIVEITAEPGDGDPSVGGPVVLRAELD